MSKNTAPVAITGGRGFPFEDHVAAYFLANMLSARPYLGSEFGCIRSVEFQVRDRGWLLDDLLVEFATSSITRRLALSIRSNKQVTRNGFSAEFVGLCWEQWQNAEQGPMRRGHDLLGLAVGRLSFEVKSAWDEVVQEAGATKENRMMGRLTQDGFHSKIHRSLFESFECPAELREGDASNWTNRGELVSRVRLLDFDFLTEPSDSEAKAVEVCRSVVQARTAEEGVRLWDRLVAISAETRPLGGSVDVATLVNRLRPDFELTDYPNHEADWRRLEQITQDSLREVRTEVGDGSRLERADIKRRIIDEMATGKLRVLIGESGSGKSAIVKELATTAKVSDLVVWLSADAWDNRSLAEVGRSIGLSADLIELLSSTRARNPLVVVDGVERLSNAALARVAELFFEIGGKGAEDFVWRILLTVESNGYEQVVRQLLANKVDPADVKPVPIGLITDTELRDLVRSDEALKGIYGRLESRAVLKNLKVLDFVLVALKTRKLDTNSQWVGVSEVMDWVWEYWIGGGSRLTKDSISRAEILKKLGELDGQCLSGKVRVADLGEEKLKTLEVLVGLGVLRCHNERVRFDHDLVGDWARVRILIGESDQLPDALLKRATQPRWQRAIRLYGQRLLEQSTMGIDTWLRALRACDGDELSHSLTRDLLLEAVFLTSNAGQLLARTWPELMADDGKLLVRVLRIFLHRATFPDPQFLEHASTPEEAARFAASVRLPHWAYWPALLFTLDKHVADLERLPGCFESVAKICSLWLHSTPTNMDYVQAFPWRKEAARIACRLAREVQGLKCENVHFQDGIDESVYSAALMASADMPEEVSNLAMELVRKCEIDKKVNARRVQHLGEEAAHRVERARDPAYQERIARRSSSVLVSYSDSRVRREPWPDGPTGRIDKGFQKVCWNDSRAFCALAAAQPNVARDVLLGVCIEPPGFVDTYGASYRMLDDLGTNSVKERTGPMFFNGPFLTFLRTEPDAALDFILRLVNFATERWRESELRYVKRKGQSKGELSFGFDVTINGATETWRGDQGVFSWYRNNFIHSDCVVSSLMALEKWFYEEIDAGNDVCRYLEEILSQSRSAAFAGVLVAIGLRTPELFEGPLLPLLGVWQLYDWRDWLVYQGDSWRIGFFSWATGSERIFNIVKDWHMMPHRKYSLRNVGIRLMLSRSLVREEFNEIRERWQALSQSEGNSEPLKLLIATFDPSNYREVPNDENRSRIEFDWPEPLKAKIDSQSAESQHAPLILGFPNRCRQQLDENATLTGGEVEQLYQQVRVIAATPVKQETDRAAAVCAGLTVLFILYGEWLAADPAREQWCISELKAILDSPPAEEVFGVPESVLTTGNDVFLAELFVVFLSKEPNNKDIRELAAGFACGFHFAATKYAMRRAQALRASLGSDFVRLQNLMIIWAALRSILHACEREESERARWSERHARLISAFRDGRISDSLLEWTRVGRIGQRAIHRLEKRRYPGIDDVDECAGAEPDWHEPFVRTGERRRQGGWSMHPGFDLQFVQASFGWVSPLHDCAAKNERAERIRILEQLLGVAFSMLPGVGNNDELRGTPSEFDYWVLEKVAVGVVGMKAEEDPGRFWRPILDLGAPAHYWVSAFLSDWFVHAVRAITSPKLFVARWREMIAYALASKQWKKGEGRRCFRLPELIMELMGLSWNNHGISGKEFAGELKLLKPEYKRFAENWLCNSEIAAAFSAFLATDSAQHLRNDGICWLKDAVVQFETRAWRTERLGDSLTDALRAAWQSDRSAVASRPELRDSFVYLLGELARQQIAEALQLRDEVAQTMPRQ